jgi:hypothetical protein
VRAVWVEDASRCFNEPCPTCKGEKAIPKMIERRGVMPTFRAMVDEMTELTKAPLLRRLHERAEEVEQLQTRVRVLEAEIKAAASRMLHAD